jgi:hypothetical protein
VLGSLFGPSGEVIQVIQYEMGEIMKDICHGPLECGTDIFYPKGHNPIGKGVPWGGKNNFLLICVTYLDLVIDIEYVNK